MTHVKTEGKRRGEFLISEAEGNRAREIVTAAHGEVWVPGQVLAKNTHTLKYEAYDNDGTTTTNAAAAISYDHVDATSADKDAVVLIRDCEVNGDELVFAGTEDSGDKNAAFADLKTHGIIVRFEDIPT